MPLFHIEKYRLHACIRTFFSDLKTGKYTYHKNDQLTYSRSFSKNAIVVHTYETRELLQKSSVHCQRNI